MKYKIHYTIEERGIMKFQIQTDGEKFRVQARAWRTLGVWTRGAVDDWLLDPPTYTRFNTFTEAQEWVDDQGQTPSKWRTI